MDEIAFGIGWLVLIVGGTYVVLYVINWIEEQIRGGRHKP